MFQSLLFLFVGTSIASGIHFFLWARLVRDAEWPERWRRRASTAMIALAASIPLTFALSRTLPPETARWATFPGFAWMGLMFVLLMLVLLADLLFALARGVQRVRGAPPPDPERRRLLARVAAGAVAATAVGTGGFGVTVALTRPAVRDVRVRLRRLPRELDGFVIAHLTDLHVGPTLGRAWVEEVVSRTNALRPDLVALTGDLVDGSVERLGPSVEPLRELVAPHGRYFVTGNHEYYSGADDWIAELARLGIRTLRNERVSIGESGASFDLAGVDDWMARGPGHGPDLPRALAGRDPSRELVLLAHQPRAVAEAARFGCGLQLSGHTHGGQIWPFTYLVYLQQPVVLGLARVGGTQIYVSPGTGFWGPPMRVGTRAEIARVILERNRA